MTKPAKHPVKAIYTMEEIIEALETLDGARVTELAETLDRPQSVIHNHLATLQELEYVIKDETEYKTSLKFLQRGEVVRNRMPLYTKAKSVVKNLAEETNELITLIVEEHGRGVYLDVAQDNADIQYPAISGTQTRLHCSAAGKAILAHMSQDEVEEIIDYHGLPSQTSNTITDRQELFEEFEEIRGQGYAYDRQEFREGMRSIGAPILDEDKNVLGGLSIAGPTHRLAGDRLKTELPNRLLQSVNIIELNYNDPNVV